MFAEEENITEVNFNVDVVEELEKQYDSAQKKHNIPGALTIKKDKE